MRNHQGRVLGAPCGEQAVGEGFRDLRSVTTLKRDRK